MVALILMIAITVIVAVMTIAGSSWSEPAVGIPDSGPLVGWAVPILEYMSAFAGVWTLSGFLIAALFAPTANKKELSPVGIRWNRTAVRSGFVWSGVAFAAANFLLVWILGLSVNQTLNLNLIITYAWEIETVRALLITATGALMISLLASKTKSVAVSGFSAAAVMFFATFSAISAHATGIGGHALAVTSGFIHVIGMSCWVAGLVGLVRYLREPKALQPLAAVSRFSKIAVVSVVMVVLSGIANSLTRIDQFSQLWTSGYGFIITLKVAGTIIALGIAGYVRKRLKENMSKYLSIILLEVATLFVVLGLATAAANTAFPKEATAPQTLIEQITGYIEPAPIDWWIAFTKIAVDPFTLLAGTFAIGLYLAGVVRLRRRGDQWSFFATTTWVLGVTSIIYVTNIELGRYALVMMSAHMIQHMTLGMLAPILLVLGSPITLALRALKPTTGNYFGPREWITATLDSKWSKLITHPLVALPVYIGSIYAIYFSSLMSILMGSHLGHIFMHIHFVLSGYLFFWLVIGTDFQPRKLAHPLRLILVLMSMVFHAFFGVVMMQSNSVLGGGWFQKVAPSWLPDVMADQVLAGSIAWSFGELPMLLVFIALGIQWAKSDQKVAARRDRQVEIYGDMELDEYNKMLNNLQKKSGQN